MTGEKTKGTFIPFRRADVIELCLADGKLRGEQPEKFKTFCRILIAYYHYRFHSVLERMKDFFAPVNPDADFKKVPRPDREDCDEKKVNTFFGDFKHLLVKANFHELPHGAVLESFKKRTLINLDIDVAFDHFDEYLLYFRGYEKTRAKRDVIPLVWSREVEFFMYRRIILLLKYKDEEYFKRLGAKTDQLEFTPGRIYMFYFKNIPADDLEMIFPGIKIRMTLRDKLLIFLPAVWFGFNALVKILPNLVILGALLLIGLGLSSYLEWFGMDENSLPDDMITTMASAYTIMLVLGTFAYKQYSSYKNKFLQFLNDVTQNLFFRKISVNAGVFQSLIDAAEEEECKEALLAYYFLLTSGEPLAKTELDQRVERWFKEKHGTDLNFDVEDALNKLAGFKAEGDTEEMRERGIEERSLVFKDGDGRWRAQPLDRALAILDSIWDHFFDFYDVPLTSCESLKEENAK